MRHFPKLDYKNKRICDIPSILSFAQGLDINDKWILHIITNTYIWALNPLVDQLKQLPATSFLLLFYFTALLFKTETKDALQYS